jgi:hypothetical protein
MRRAPCVLLAVLCSGCAAFASKSDYRDYRAVRLASDSDQRLLAMQRYVAAHPDGRWHDEVQRERSARERAIFESNKGDRKGLELYLTAFPRGAFAPQARARLSAIEVIEQRKRDETARAALLEEQRKAREAELSRTWLTRFMEYWARTLLAIDAWGAPIETVASNNPEFSRAFGRAPRPRCTSEECVKYYESSYAVPVPGGTRIERSVRLVMRLRLDQGRLTGAELLIPARGFSRWKEIEDRQAVVDGDPQARKGALDFALARLLPLVTELLPTRQPQDGYALPELRSPKIGSTGELVDTTAQDPSSPSNRIQGDLAPASEREGAPAIAELVAPAAPEQAPDMVMSPLLIGPDGRPLPRAAEQPRSGEAQPGSGEVMEMAPVVVPRAPGTPSQDAGTTTQPPSAPAPAASVAQEPGFTQAFQANGLRVVIFAASSDAAAPAFDGLLIERADPKSAKRSAPRLRAPLPGVRAEPPREPTQAQ